MLTMRRVDSGNLWDIVKLTVDETQKGFVASNTESLLEAYACTVDGKTALPFGIYNDETPVGFVMFGYGRTDKNDPAVAEGNYSVWRFMIDKKYQRQGFGKAAMEAALEYLRSKPCGEAMYCWLSYEPENTVAEKLYGSYGFVPNGEVCCGEIVAVLKL